MKKVFLLALSLLLLLGSSAQVVITSDDLMDVGDSVHLATADTVPAGFNPGPPGANLHWDFSSLEMDTSSYLKFVDPATTPYGANFPESNIAVEGLADNLIEGAWAYTTKNNFVFQIDGLAGSYDIFEDVIGYLEPSEVMFSFPINYLDTLQSTSTVDITIPSPEPPFDSVRLKVVTSVDMVVDAWGELTTPDWTGDVLRMRDVRVTVDSVWAKLLFFWTYIQSNTTVSITYKYMANDLGYPALQFFADTSDTEFSGISYMLDAGVGVAEPVDPEQLISVYPNPAADEINIRYPISGIRNAIFIYDLYGREMAEVATQNELTTVDVSDYPAGVYVAVVRDQNGNSSKGKFVVK
jgi:hypothetical protein